jgi:hypothetical protein
MIRVPSRKFAAQFPDQRSSAQISGEILVYPELQ